MHLLPRLFELAAMGGRGISDYLRGLWLGRDFWISYTRAFSWTGYTKKGGMTEEFIAKIYTAAKATEEATGIPWRFAAVQAGHESRQGQSKLTVEANNLFGMTAGSWKKAGKPLYEITTQEHSSHAPEFWAQPGRYFESQGDVRDVRPDGLGGSWLTVSRAFRKYQDWAESMEDWAQHIVDMYPQAYAGAKAGDFVSFAKGLQAGGYATDPNYAMELVRLNQQWEGQLAQAPAPPEPPPSEAPPQNS